MHHHYAVTSVLQEAEEQAWGSIESGAGVFLSELDGVTLGDLSPGSAGHERMTRWIEAYRPILGDVLIVDPQWHLLFPQAVPDKAEESESPPAIVWAPTTTDVDAQDQLRIRPLRGTTTLADGEHLAVAGALNNDQGYVLIHRAVSDIEADARRIVQSFPAISGLTYVWLLALLGLLSYMVLARIHDVLEGERSRTATDTLRQSQHLVRTRDAVIFGLAKLTEYRDSDTGDHLERISVYSTTLASALRNHPKFCDEVTPAFVRLIGISAALHDIGKVGVEDHILLKKGPLTAKERTKIEQHTTIAGQCLREIEQRLGGSNFLQMARQIAMGHHEAWNGGGYPKGVAGDAIPLAARIVAVADLYDALSSKRSYKDAFSHERCIKIIREEAGKKLDPNLVDVWLSVESDFRNIALKYSRPAPSDCSADVKAVLEQVHGAEAECPEKLLLASATAASE
jgi:HD-GYP domain-containing protein (c-di-GMP phosphodiesterase class II)